MRKLILTSALVAGTLLAQGQVAQKETEVTAITKHGRRVVTDKTNSTTYTDGAGNATTHSTSTQTVAKKHHGHYKQKTTTSSSTSSTQSNPE